MSLSFCAVGTLAFIAHKKRKDLFYTYFFVLFVLFLLLEISVYESIANGFFHRLILKHLRLDVGSRIPCYCGLVLILYYLTFELLELQASKVKAHVIFLCMMCWFITTSLLIDAGAFSAWLFILPVQLFLFFFGTYGMRHLPPRGKRSSKQALGSRIFTLEIFFSILIFLEDTVNLFIISPDKSQIRNYSEAVLQILISAVYAKFIFSFVIDGSPSEVASAEEPKVLSDVSRYANRFNLTSRETDVLSLLLQNKSYNDIAEHLFISEGTVKTHTHNILQKCEVRSKSELKEQFVYFLKEPQDSSLS